jgi:hypothetical protein
MQPTKISHIVRVTVMSAALLVLSGAGAQQGAMMEAQQTGAGTVANPGANMPPGVPRLDLPADGTEADPEVRARMEHQREKALNDDRQKRLAADVDRLVELTNELKVDLAKTNKNELSIEVIKKAQEIEKLAHDVQSRMKN